MDISEWLRGLDLAQYGPIFRENAIDAEILPELTEADLEKLGVVLGHRKRMLRAIAVLEAPAIAMFIDPGKVMIFDLSNPPTASAKPTVAMGTTPGWHAFTPVSPPHLAFTVR